MRINVPASQRVDYKEGRGGTDVQWLADKRDKLGLMNVQ